jgi:hypothetical protein
MKTGKEIASKKVTRNPDVKAHLGAIKGSKIDLPGGSTHVPPPPRDIVYHLHLVGLVVQIHTYDYPTSVITYKDLLYDRVLESPAISLDVSGVSSAGSDGISVFRVMTFVPYELQTLAEPVHIVATPHGSVPSFLTVEHTLVISDTSKDIEITVYAWDPNGNPAPDVVFDWRCRFNGYVQELDI